MLIDFCLPVRNEEKILVTNARRLKDFLINKNWPFTWRIIIIINGSQDASAELAIKMQKEDPQRVQALIISDGGKGLALKKCFSESLADFLVFMDIDLAVSLDNLPELIEPLINNQSDLVFGSRLLLGSKTERSFYRESSSRLYNSLSRLVLRHHFSDLQCGFKAIRREAFNRITPFLKDDHWFFDTELIILLKKFNYRLLEIPVDWQENRYDERTSKIRAFRDGWHFFSNIF